MVNQPAQVWLITGCSSGFGREIALVALKRSDRVVATARDPSKLDDLKARGALTVALDVTADDAELQKAVAKIIETTGRIDILVNSAGYILTGAVEECSRGEVLDHFQTNVFGPLNVLRAVLPYMRAQGSGVIANFGSIGSWAGTPAAGLYCATKAAVSTYTESLRQEVAHLGIDVTVVEPGYFRTGFLSPGHRYQAAHQIAELRPGIDAMLANLQAYDYQQPGDPVKGAEIVVEALTRSGRCQGKVLPARLAVGNDAVPYMTAVMDAHRQTLDEWKDLVTSTDCE